MELSKGERRKIINKMVEMWNKGASARDIQEEFPQFSRPTIYYMVHSRKGAEYRQRGHGHNCWKPVEDWKVWWLYHNTDLNSREIAEVVGRSKSSVSSRMNQIGTRYHIPASEPPEEYRFWLESKAPRFIERLGGVGCGD